MWHRKKKPKVVVHTLTPELNNTVTQILQAIVNTPRVPMSVPSFDFPAARIYQHQRSPEEIEAEMKETTEVDAFISKMEPEIKTQTEALIKEEIRDMLLLGGNRQRILALLRAGKTPRLVRKKEGRRDPLFLQFGDGVTDPIEEMQILG